MDLLRRISPQRALTSWPHVYNHPRPYTAIGAPPQITHETNLYRQSTWPAHRQMLDLVLQPRSRPSRGPERETGDIFYVPQWRSKMSVLRELVPLCPARTGRGTESDTTGQAQKNGIFRGEIRPRRSARLLSCFTPNQGAFHTSTSHVDRCRSLRAAQRVCRKLVIMPTSSSAHGTTARDPTLDTTKKARAHRTSHREPVGGAIDRSPESVKLKYLDPRAMGLR